MGRSLFGWTPGTESTSHPSIMILGSDFFLQPPQVVAREILGDKLCAIRENGIIESTVITETEAYDGECDEACHAHKGKTARTAMMYQAGGIWYVYLCYGIHWMLNLVTGPQDYPAAVLIRGTVEFRGPGRLTKGMRVDGSLNGRFLSKDSLWIERSNERPSEVFAGPRIGIDYAGSEWREKPWRFWFSNPAELP